MRLSPSQASDQRTKKREVQERLIRIFQISMDDMSAEFAQLLQGRCIRVPVWYGMFMGFREFMCMVNWVSDFLEYR